MSSESEIVQVSVVGGPQASVRWREGITALQAMELASAAIEPDPNEQFTFGLQYYGSALGYLVNMINETYDSFISRGGEKASPFFYWDFLVNGKPATKSVDRTILSRNDTVSFSFERYVDERHGHTLLKHKNLMQSGKG